MPHLNRNLRCLTNCHGFPQRLEDAISFIPNVSSIDTPILRGDFTKFDNLLSLRIGCWGIHEGSAQTEGTLPHSLRNEFLHPLQLIARWFTVVVAEDVFTDLCC